MSLAELVQPCCRGCDSQLAVAPSQVSLLLSFWPAMIQFVPRQLRGEQVSVIDEGAVLVLLLEVSDCVLCESF